MYADNIKVSNLPGLAIYLFGYISMLLTYYTLSYILLSLWHYRFQFPYDLSFIMLNEHSTISPVKMLRQGRTRLLNTGCLFVLNALFHQTSNLSFSSCNGNSELVSYFCF